MPQKRIHSYQSGQAVLIIIVGMMIALTVGLSVATRSIINLQTTTEEDQSQRAFSAAEAGVEQALQNNENISDISLENNATIKQVTVNTIEQNNLLLNNGTPVLRNEPIDIWLSDYPDYSSPRSGVLNIYWGTATDCNEAALEIITITGATPQSATTSRTVLDPCAARRGTNNFTSPSAGATAGGTALQYGASLSVTSGLLVRVIPLYQNTTIGVVSSGGLVLPSQGAQIESTGQAGQTQRKITVYRGFPKIPYEFFPLAMFSP